MVKFPFLIDIASKEGADAVATGHYARTAMGPIGRTALFRGIDPLKDQSYMLYRLPVETLPALVFPLGEMTKEQVSLKGRTLFPGMFSDLPESEDLCFLPADNLTDICRTRQGYFRKAT